MKDATFAASRLLGLFTMTGPPARSEEIARHDESTFEASILGLAAGMAGDLTVKGVPADLDVSSGDTLQHLAFDAMGSTRVGYDRWALNTEFRYDILARGPQFRIGFPF